MHSGLDVGTPKLRLIHRLLHHRRNHPALYESDTYEPLVAGGARADHVVAFARDRLAVVAPCRSLDDWNETSVGLPPGEWSHLVTHERFKAGRLPVANLLGRFPVAVLAKDVP
jgi:(1->4)-alpha-D-glucan 1-alpha-D-glucosylmutase